LRGLKFNAIHGVNDDEKRFPQPFVVDVDAWMDMRRASRTDDLDHTVSYAAVYR
jgi:dihydroneopterin aldolase